MTVFEMNNAIDRAYPSRLDRYAIYLRKSREDLKAEQRGEGETLARHRKILTDYAARQGLYIEKIYEEIVSGETIKDREQIQKLISDCYAGKYKGVIVMEISRLSRGNQGDAQIILDCFKFSNNNSGILVHTPTRIYDIAHNPDDEEYMEFELFMSRREYKMIQKRLLRGKEQSVVEGNYVASYRPYGYDILETMTARTLIPNNAEAPIIKKIFEWKAYDKMTPAAIARKLTAMGIPTYTGGVEWSRDTIKQILRNPVYYGKVRWNNRMTVKSMVDGELVSSRPKSNQTERYMEYDGKHEGIITEELFMAAQQGFTCDKSKASHPLKNILAGLLVCQKCQRTMVYESYKCREGTNPRYHHTRSQICKVKSALYEDVMDAFIHGLKMYLENFQTLISNQPEVDENEIEKQIHALEAEKKRIQKVLSQIFDDYENHIYTPNEFVERKAKHNNRLEAIEKEIIELENTIPEKTEYEEKIVYLHEALDMLKDDDISAKLKNEYLKQFIQRIEFSRESDNEFTLDIYLL